MFQDADTRIKGATIDVLGDGTIYSYITCATGIEMWDALDAKYGDLMSVVICIS